MVMYVVIAPLAAAYVDRLPRKAFLAALDVVRAAVVLALPFITEVWHIYVLIAVLQSASAAFTPTFQAVIPDIVREESDYTRALSASQVAYTMETLLSPVLAALALTFMSFNWLFVGTAIGFVVRVPRALHPDSERAPQCACERLGQGGVGHQTLRQDAQASRHHGFQRRGGGRRCDRGGQHRQLRPRHSGRHGGRRCLDARCIWRRRSPDRRCPVAGPEPRRGPNRHDGRGGRVGRWGGGCGGSDPDLRVVG